MKSIQLATLLVLLINAPGLAQRSDFWDISFQKADSIAFQYEGHDLKHPDKLAQDLVRGLTTDVEKFRVIFRWITDNIRYDYQLYMRRVKIESQLKYKPKRLSAFAERSSKRTYTHMIRRREAICSGYATLLEYMCGHVGLQCEFISGYARAFSLPETRKPNHAWNAIKLDDKWYLVDATWASGFIDPFKKTFFEKFNSNYFLTDPSLFISNHYPVEGRWILLKDAPSLTEFARAPFKADGFIKNKINHYSPALGVVRIKENHDFELHFTSNAERVNPRARIAYKERRGKVYSENELLLTRNKAGDFILKFLFSKKGTYECFIYINDEVTFAYHIVVI